MAKPRCFFDITIGGSPTGRIVFEVSTLSFDYRAYDSCTHTAHFFLRQIVIALVRICATPLLTVDAFFCYLQLRADVVPKTAGRYKACSTQFRTNITFNSASDKQTHLRIPYVVWAKMLLELPLKCH